MLNANPSDFAVCLAGSPPYICYKTPKTQWQAMRLGLYQTVIDNEPLIRTKKLKVVRFITKSKRFLFTAEQAKAQIFFILSQSSFKNYHKELIKETFHLYPEIYCEFFENNRHFLTDDYYCGLYLSFKKNDKDTHFFKHLNSIDKQLLYSNLWLDTPLKKLENFNQLLKHYQLSPIELIDNNQAFCVTNIQTHSQNFIDNPNQVTILITAFNAEKTLMPCIESLLKQTYQNLQLIVIDDNSTDNMLAILKNLIKKDNRIIGIHLPKNTGTFVAKSIGAMYATGNFLTCHDADDVAHPQKIERQVLPLLANEHLVATTSHWCRLDDKGEFYARQYYPFLRQNPASPLFRFQKIKNEMGLWHIAKTGADSEFWERLKLVYGNDKLLTIKEPLTFASQRANSLMNSTEFGVHNQQSALNRMNYWENWRLWHIDGIKRGKIFMPTLSDQLAKNLFEIPPSLVVNVDDIRYNLEYHSILK